MALVGRYETYQQLGKGSTGTVYRARDLVLGREVALKILNPGSRFSSRLLDLFFTDEQSASEWLHPNIATIHDLGDSALGPFVAAELLTGTTMRKHIVQRTNFSLVQKLDFFRQVCNGLAHAHRNGVVHAAITPGSFFVTEMSQVKILDLGIRRIAQSMGVAEQKSGELDYLAPEQVWEKSCDIRSDLFSACVVFYEFLVHTHPFASPFVPQRVIDDLPDDLLKVDPGLPASLVQLINRALSRLPVDRPQSATELAASFRAVELEISSPLMHRFGDRPRFPDRAKSLANKSWEGHSNVRSFLELLHNFDATLASQNWDEAEHLLQRMKSHSPLPEDDEFVPAILESETRLKIARELKASDEEVGTVPIRIESEPVPVAFESDVARSLENSESPQVKLKRSLARLLSLPSFSLQIRATIVVSVLLLGAALFSTKWHRTSPPKVVARAKVIGSDATILDSPAADARHLATLKEGSWVNILDGVPSHSATFVHVQATFTGKAQWSGYTLTSDLGNWLSNDPEVAWNLLLFERPSGKSDPAKIGRYLEELQSFNTRFHNSKQAAEVDSETSYWKMVLAGTVLLPQPSQGLRQTDHVLTSGTSFTPNAAVNQSKEKVKHILDRIPALWDEGNLEAVVELARQAAALDPENQQVIAWRFKATKALRKLNDQ